MHLLTDAKPDPTVWCNSAEFREFEKALIVLIFIHVDMCSIVDSHRKAMCKEIYGCMQRLQYFSFKVKFLSFLFPFFPSFFLSLSLSLSLSLLFFFIYSINFPKYRKYTFISCKQKGYLSQPRKETLLGCSSNKKNIRNRHIKRSKAYCGYVNHWIWIILKLYGPLMKSSIMCQWHKPWNIFKCTNPFLLRLCAAKSSKTKTIF